MRKNTYRLIIMTIVFFSIAFGNEAIAGGGKGGGAVLSAKTTSSVATDKAEQ